MPASKPREKLHNLYDRIQTAGLFIAPENDIKLNKTSSVKLNLNGSEALELCKESYNSSLLLTLLTSLFKRGNMVYFGPPGAGKTTAPEFIGHFIYGKPLDEIHRATIFGHPEQTQEMMVARYSLSDLMTGEERVLVRQFMNSPIKIIDEVNRLPPGKLSILYQLVDRGFTDYGDEVVKAEDGPIFMTANAADAGNYPLPHPFLDRIGVAVVATYLNPCYLSILDKRGSDNLNGGIEDLLDIKEQFTAKDLEQARHEIREVAFEGDELYHLMHFLAETNYCYKGGVALESKSKSHAQFKKPGKGLCTDCHYFPGTGKTDKGTICHMTEEGISPRTYQSIILYAKALAWYRGNDKVNSIDLEAIMPFCLWHKITPTDSAYEANPLFINDRTELVRNLFDRSKKTYLQNKKTYDIYDSILETASKASTGAITPENKAEITKTIRNFLENLQSIDSVAKYPLAVTLAQIYKRIDANAT